MIYSMTTSRLHAEQVNIPRVCIHLCLYRLILVVGKCKQAIITTEAS